MSSELERTRDIYMKSEKEYLKELKNDPKYKKTIRELSRRPYRELIKSFAERIDAIESGKVTPEDLEKVETEALLISAAIHDMEREKER